MVNDLKVKRTVLIIEDEEPMRELLVDVLSSSGWEAVGAADGQEGLSKALARHPALILLDLLLPGMSGLEMLKQLRTDAWGKEVPVMVLSNLSDPEIITEAMNTGTNKFVLKAGLRLDDLLREVQQIVHEAV